MTAEFDIVIAGAGPAGLSFARSLAGSGLAVGLVEPQPATSLADPPFDGREIALTHHSAHLLRTLGLWDRFPTGDIHTLRDAQVLDGDANAGMRLDHGECDRPQLGFLVANQVIRRAAFAAVQGQERLTLFAERRVTAVEPGAARSRVKLSDGQMLTARLMVAADSRFSETRRAMGIRADLQDYGKTMLVCRMTHAQPHHHVAWEWFGYGQTLALLPLDDRDGEHRASVVLTLPHREIGQLMDLPDAEFARRIEARFGHRLGAMSLASTRHAYPLVSVYPHRFTAARFALLGDAAVGMHPVTAHGFNFGLLGQDLLARRVLRANALGEDIASERLLGAFERELRRATRPLYLATRALVLLYTDDRAPARLVRRAALGAASRLRPFRRALVHTVAQSGDSRAATFPLLGMLRAMRG